MDIQFSTLIKRKYSLTAAVVPTLVCYVLLYILFLTMIEAIHNYGNHELWTSAGIILTFDYHFYAGPQLMTCIAEVIDEEKAIEEQSKLETDIRKQVYLENLTYEQIRYFIDLLIRY